MTQREEIRILRAYCREKDVEEGVVVKVENNINERKKKNQQAETARARWTRWYRRHRREQQARQKKRMRSRRAGK